MQPVPYLFFRGDCRAAMTFYADTFGAPDTLQLMPISDAPAEVRAQMGTAATGDWIMHGALRVGDGWLYASDDMTGETPAMAGVSISLDFPTADETRRVFGALARGGEVRMPLSPMFWSPLFGMLTDRFGIRWMIGQAAPA